MVNLELSPLALWMVMISTRMPSAVSAGAKELFQFCEI